MTQRVGAGGGLLRACRLSLRKWRGAADERRQRQYLETVQQMAQLGQQGATPGFENTQCFSGRLFVIVLTQVEHVRVKMFNFRLLFTSV